MIRKYGRDSLASFFPPGRINIKILLPVIFFLAYLTIVFGYAHFTNNDQIILDRTEKFHSLQIFRGSTLESITYVVGLVLIAPVLEEILYRGIFFPPFERKLGSGGAICLISFLWALTHLNIDAIASIFIMGLVLGYLYKQTKSLLSGIIFHSLINVFAILTYIFQCF
ncbi:MAG: CPBP family intramembrane metalloprotease [Desulfobulbaceae bacterium]|nr:CPBP family intramembrane metalloprotease [Desulfobulbaceae bacterium]